MPTSPLPPQQRQQQQQQQQKPSPTTLPPNAPSLASLNIPEDPYHLHSWPEVRLLIQHNRLDAFHRIPEELERYLIYCAGIRKRYGSMMDFILRERLKWGGEEERRGDEGEKAAEEVEGFEGFGDESSYKILPNDWPYALDPRITHLVVWTKRSIPDDPASPIGDIDPQARRTITAFVREKFLPAVGNDPDRLVWFRNWAAIKSVHAVEHIHVLLFGVEEGFVERVTGEKIKGR